jgi:hypothetical protein
VTAAVGAAEPAVREAGGMIYGFLGHGASRAWGECTNRGAGGARFARRKTGPGTPGGHDGFALDGESALIARFRL